MNALNIIQDLLDADKVIEMNKADVSNKMDKLLEAMQTDPNADYTFSTIHEFWNMVYEGKQWSYMVYDAELNKMIKVEGDKAPAKIQTYKSQSVKAYKELGRQAFDELASWSDLKDAIKAVPTEEQERINAVIKALKEKFKSGNNEDRVELLEYMEKTLNV
tara:strand:+ start:9896 stop:10378 length:483 start_codon:yes stop_codon:yes gene_type:complete